MIYSCDSKLKYEQPLLQSNTSVSNDSSEIIVICYYLSLWIFIIYLFLSFATHLYCLDIHSWAPDPALCLSLNPAEDKPSNSLCLINWPFNITRSFPCFRFISCPSNDHLHLHLPYGHQLFLTRHHQPLFIMGRCNKPKISAKKILIHCVIFGFPSAL